MAIKSFGVGGEGKNSCTGATCKGQKHKLLGGYRGMSSRNILQSGPRRLHFQNSGAKIRVFEQNTDIIK